MSDVLPELQPVLAAVAAAPPMDFGDIAALRIQSDQQVEAFSSLYVPDAPSVTTTVEVIDVPDGEIEVRVHRPDGDTHAGTLVHLHGGGWILGSAKQTDRVCRRLAARTGSVVVSPEYRLAPEHPFPTPLEDCYAAVVWADERFGPVAVGGQSAGGNLAAAVALLCRDRNGPRLVAQWLDVPATDLSLPEDESLRAFGKGFGLDIADVAPTVGLYCSPEHLRHPYVSPLLAPSLDGLPPAVVTVAGCDPLRDQGERYARALETAGVPVRLTRWEGHLHATMTLTTLHPSGLEYENEVAGGLAEYRQLAPRPT